METQCFSEYFVRRYLRKIIIPKKKISLPILVAMMGPVGVGKTTVAQIIAKKLHIAHVRTDDVRVFLRGCGVPSRSSLNKGAVVAQRVARELLRRGVGVLLDADFTFPKSQHKIRNLAENCNARVFFVAVRSPERVVLDRLQKHRYTEADIFRDSREAIAIYFVRKKQYRTIKSLPKPFAVIDNTKSPKEQIRHISQRILSAARA